MKTTVEIADSLFHSAKALAVSEGRTFRAILEEALRALLQAQGDEQAYRWRPVTFGGQGMDPELEASGWDAIRDRAYEGRGS